MGRRVSGLAREARGKGGSTVINGLSHVNIGVSNMERSLSFYRDILGLQISVDREERYEQLDLHQHAVYLRWGDAPGSSFVVLDRQLNREPFGDPPVLQQNGMNHFGFWVNDLDAILERARAAGLPVGNGGLHDGAAYGSPNGGKVRSNMLRDPDGAYIQLDQWVELPS
jgi:catechol 2,3-dioxygenase-like lactoylglutathione lyase family enzyme